MKKLLVLTLLVLAAASSALAREITPAVDDALVAFNANVHARVGMSRAELVAQLGEPAAKLGEGAWAFWDFRAAGLPTLGHGEALVVIFKADRVSVLRCTTRSAVEAALRQLRADAVSRGAVAQR